MQNSEERQFSAFKLTTSRPARILDFYGVLGLCVVAKDFWKKILNHEDSKKIDRFSSRFSYFHAKS